ELSDGAVVMRVQGAFDASLAWQVGNLLAAAKPNSHVTLDFSRASGFPDSVVATLAQGMSKAKGTVSLLGIGSHQRRILQYFGVVERAAAPLQPE
ncbi:MAG TPA: hypothetical protein VLV17_06470, partial [Anaeromyxobacteraceae bacterium]|nr:hypothetical protein [Anaeromyxobacteraceae bacterium]